MSLMENQQFTTETIEEFADEHSLNCDQVAELFELPMDWEETDELADYEITFDDVAEAELKIKVMFG